MNVVFDSNIYISFLNSSKYSDLMYESSTHKYLSGTVLLELWERSKTNKAIQNITKLHQTYFMANRVLLPQNFTQEKIKAFLYNLPKPSLEKMKQLSFNNNISIAFEALSIGATLFTENEKDYSFIKNRLPNLSIQYV